MSAACPLAQIVRRFAEKPGAKAKSDLKKGMLSMNQRDSSLADATSNFLVRIIFFLVKIGTFGLMKVLYNQEIRQKAFLNDTNFPNRLFNFKGRAGRLEYFLVVLVIFLIVLPFNGWSGPMDNNLVNFALLVFVVFVMVIIFALPVRRCRDLSVSPWAILLLFIPVVGLFLAIALWFLPGGIEFDKIY